MASGFEELNEANELLQEMSSTIEKTLKYAEKLRDYMISSMTASNRTISNMNQGNN